MIAVWSMMQDDVRARLGAEFGQLGRHRSSARAAATAGGTRPRRQSPPTRVRPVSTLRAVTVTPGMIGAARVFHGAGDLRVLRERGGEQVVDTRVARIRVDLRMQPEHLVVSSSTLDQRKIT